VMLQLPMKNYRSRPISMSEMSIYNADALIFVIAEADVPSVCSENSLWNAMELNEKFGVLGHGSRELWVSRSVVHVGHGSVEMTRRHSSALVVMCFNILVTDVDFVVSDVRARSGIMLIHCLQTAGLFYLEKLSNRLSSRGSHCQYPAVSSR